MKCPFCNDYLIKLKIGIYISSTVFFERIVYYESIIKENIMMDDKEYFYQIDFDSNEFIYSLNTNSVSIQYTTYDDEKYVNEGPLHRCKKSLVINIENDKIYSLMIDNNNLYTDVYSNIIKFYLDKDNFEVNLDTKLDNLKLNNSNNYIQEISDIVDYKYNLYKMLK